MHTENKRRRKREGTKEIFEATMTENFPQINVRHQSTDPGTSENTMQDMQNKQTNKQKIQHP